MLTLKHFFVTLIVLIFLIINCNIAFTAGSDPPNLIVKFTLKYLEPQTNKLVVYKTSSTDRLRTFEVPAGVYTGKKLRLKGKGQPSPYGGHNGDLFIQVKVLDHPLFERDGDDLIMGMDDFAQKLAGEIVYVQLPDEGKKIKAGKKFAKVESGKWLGKVYGPVNGELVAVNEDLEENPGLINEDCYGKGWMYRIKPADKAGLNNLMHEPEAIEKWLLADIEKYVEDDE